MIRTVEAWIDAQGNVSLLETLQLAGPCRTLVTILEQESALSETTLLSEPALAEDWNRPEEEAARSHLQPGQ
jgi:hypothetical protein